MEFFKRPDLDLHLTGAPGFAAAMVEAVRGQGLEVEESRFSVTLSFNDRHERLTVPFEAVTAFADPAVKFGLRFERQEDGSPAAAATPSATNLPEEQSGASDSSAERPAGEGAKVVALETFRKK